MKTSLRTLLCLALVLLLLLTLTGCGGDDSKSDTTQSNASAMAAYDIHAEVNKTVLIENTKYEENRIPLGTVETPLDPRAIYDSLEYDYRMLYGQYKTPGVSSASYELFKETPLMDYKTEYAEQLTVVPCEIEAGPQTLCHKLAYVAELHVARLDFLTEDGNLKTLYCDYRFEGDQLLFYPIDFTYLNDKDMYEYTLAEEPFAYQFRFEGRKLTLTKDGYSTDLYSDLSAYSDKLLISADSILDADSKGIDDITRINVGYGYFFEYEFSSWFRVTSDRWNSGQKAVAEMAGNGLMTMTLRNAEEETETYQFVYFLCGDDGIILADKENTYFYCSSDWAQYQSILGTNLGLSDQETISNIQPDVLEEIVVKRANLLTDLGAAFRDAGIAIQMDEESGSIALDAAILFPTAEYALSQDGKDMLKEFMDIYCSVVFDEKYEGFVSKIVVEGHTDSTGSYEMNLELSQNRANSVSDYILSGECLSDATYAQSLETMLQTIGYSYDKLIYNADGTENMDASRRVCFSFLINLQG